MVAASRDHPAPVPLCSMMGDLDQRIRRTPSGRDAAGIMPAVDTSRKHLRSHRSRTCLTTYPRAHRAKAGAHKPTECRGGSSSLKRARLGRQSITRMRRRAVGNCASFAHPCVVDAAENTWAAAS